MSRWRVILWPGIATLAAFGTLLALGTWQLQRKQEKETMLAALEASISAVPVALGAGGIDLATVTVFPSATRTLKSPALPELMRVTVSGAYVPSRSVPVRATLPTSSKGGVAGGIGYFWMTPLQVDGGGIVFINRGFVPSGMGWKAPAIATPEGRQTITGLIRLPEKVQTFTPADVPAKGEYFTRDPETMAQAVSVTNVVNFFIDAERIPNNVTPPVGIEARETIARIPNNHLQYAGTWFGFALTLLGVFGFFAYGRLKDFDRAQAQAETKP
ncbi:MAG: SURF1 family protein [Beijerinckiaceae bacterium]